MLTGYFLHCTHFLLAVSSGWAQGAGLQLFMLASQTKNQKNYLQQTILPIVLTIFSTKVIIRHVTVTSTSTTM